MLVIPENVITWFLGYYLIKLIVDCITVKIKYSAAQPNLVGGVLVNRIHQIYRENNYKCGHELKVSDDCRFYRNVRFLNTVAYQIIFKNKLTQPVFTCSKSLKHQNSLWKLFKVNNKDAKTTSHWLRCGVFIVNFEQI